MDGTAQPVTVLGAGSWGTALAILLAQNERPVTLWAHRAEHIATMQTARCNARYLPEQTFPASLALEADLERAIAASHIVLVVVPSHAFRETLHAIAPMITPEHVIAWASKGLEPHTHKLLHEVMADEVGNAHSSAVISGPTFAREVAAGLPTAVTVASGSEALADLLAARLHTDTFRAYMANDVVGVEIGGAIKNVLAIAAGIADGLGFGANTRAALITRGLAEITRFGLAHGAQPETFMGLAGLGDLVLTCTDDQSRNRRFGKALAAGQTPQQAFATIGQVVEGAETARVLHEMCRRMDIDMPISEQVYRVVHKGLDPHTAVHELLNRAQKHE
jgi:glycerol-3-phosphate dehydrogenase (NAD(P)+)